MFDALLLANRDAVWNANFGYGNASLCDVMPDGRPPPRCGDLFVSIHELDTHNRSRRNLDEYFDFGVTLTQRVTNVSPDRIGDALLARKLARQPGPGNTRTFNGRVEQLKYLLHQNWDVLFNPQTGANTYLQNLLPSAGFVYGFLEPALYTGGEGKVEIVGGEWFSSDPEALDMGIKAELRFEGARRLQPQTASVGPFV